jgi:hypothetical protein
MVETARAVGLPPLGASLAAARGDGKLAWRERRPERAAGEPPFDPVGWLREPRLHA